jgi:hypothetical protein
VPFLRFSRDRRGYEHFYVVEPASGRRGKTRERVLYWFRTPPNVKVGREPFDDHVMRALEAKHPGIRFDWEALRNTPIPSVEPEYWRERRRADRAARRAQEEEEAETETAASEPSPSEPPPTTDAPGSDVAVQAISEAVSGTSSDDVMSTTGAEPGVRNEPGVGNEPGVRNEPGAGNSGRQQRRRRRRRGQRQRGPVVGKTAGDVPSDSPKGGGEDM